MGGTTAGGCSSGVWRTRWRRVATGLAVADGLCVVAVLSAAVFPSRGQAAAATPGPVLVAAAAVVVSSAGAVPPASTLPPIGAAVPGDPHVSRSGPSDRPRVALTFDDGTCEQCVANVVEFVERTSTPVTLCPNGAYGPISWDRWSGRIRPLIARGLVALCNHTFDHKDLTRLSSAAIADQLTREEAWVQHTFGVSTRPFFRPPYGARDKRVDKVAASLGWTEEVLWDGTFGDSLIHPPDFLLGQLDAAAHPGLVMLGHVNHLPTSLVLDDVLGHLQARGLQPVTLPVLFERS